ncbi:MAG TPA: tRNA (guanosine(37)-N1)-methyltransferase TrmD [Candidatus Cryosericum sp.]|nr:tRNA (guanosine(37)-N1)-methyltransferase TrmD [Candidatus Cryosericum sp.]
MRIKAVSIFPQLYEPFTQVGVMKMAIDKGALQFEAVDLRAFTHDRHHTTDDVPFGGGAGMVFLPGPVLEALDAIDRPAGSWIKIGVAPQGDRLTQRMVEDLAHEDQLVFLAGRYEGVDERVMERLDLTISVGDVVLSGGEIATIEIIDAITRLLPGATGNAASTGDESFTSGLLEYPQYTRPRELGGDVVPDVLVSGHHANIARWRKEEALKRTLIRRPDLLQSFDLTEQDRRYLKALLEELRRTIG